MGCPLLKKKLVIMIILYNVPCFYDKLVVGIQPGPLAEYHLLSTICSFLFSIFGVT